MAFYYEADPPTWKYKERYNGWNEFPKKVTVKLEKMWQKINQRGDTSNVHHEWTDPHGQTWTINVQNLTASMGSYSYRNSEVSREGYPYPNRGNESKLSKIFNKYADQEEKDALDEEKLASFFGDLGVDPNAVQSLVVFAMMELEQLGIIERNKFVKGFAKCGASSLRDVNSTSALITNSMRTKKKVMKGFCRWLFNASRERLDARTVPKEACIQLMDITLDDDQFPLKSDVLDFLDEDARQVLTRDDWEMLIEFLWDVKSLDQFDEDAGWPIICEEFVEWQTARS